MTPQGIPEGLVSGLEKLSKMTAEQVRAFRMFFVLAGAGIAFLFFREWPEMTMDRFVQCAAFLAAGNIGLLERGFRYRQERLDMEACVHIRMAVKSGMPKPPKGTYYARACRNAAVNALWAAMCESLVCLGYLSFMPAGGYVLIGHMGLRLLEERIQELPEAQADRETEDSIALTIAMVHALAGGVLGVFAWLACH